jgi:hypothetical protein
LEPSLVSFVYATTDYGNECDENID